MVGQVFIQPSDVSENSTVTTALSEDSVNERRNASEYYLNCGLVYEKWCIKRWFDESLDNVTADSPQLLVKQPSILTSNLEQY
jgi:hypothetical protein